MPTPAPGALVLGVGCRRGTSVEHLQTHLAQVLGRHGRSDAAIGLVVTVAAKADEPGVQALAARLGAELVAYPAAVLAAQQVAGSATVAAAVGTGSVAEAAVLASGARLVASKHAHGRSTMALGLRSEPPTPRRGP